MNSFIINESYFKNYYLWTRMHYFANQLGQSHGKSAVYVVGIARLLIQFFILLKVWRYDFFWNKIDW